MVMAALQPDPWDSEVTESGLRSMSDTEMAITKQ